MARRPSGPVLAGSILALEPRERFRGFSHPFMLISLGHRTPAPLFSSCEVVFAAFECNKEKNHNSLTNQLNLISELWQLVIGEYLCFSSLRTELSP